MIAWGCDPADYLGTEQLRFLERIKTAVVGLDETSDMTGAYAQFFRDRGICGLLVRPDFIVFGVAQSPAELAGRVDSLRAQLEAMARRG